MKTRAVSFVILLCMAGCNDPDADYQQPTNCQANADFVVAVELDKRSYNSFAEPAVKAWSAITLSQDGLENDRCQAALFSVSRNFNRSYRCYCLSSA